MTRKSSRISKTSQTKRANNSKAHQATSQLQASSNKTLPVSPQTRPSTKMTTMSPMTRRKSKLKFTRGSSKNSNSAISAMMKKMARKRRKRKMEVLLLLELQLILSHIPGRRRTIFMPILILLMNPQS